MITSINRIELRTLITSIDRTDLGTLITSLDRTELGTLNNVCGGRQHKTVHSGETIRALALKLGPTQNQIKQC